VIVVVCLVVWVASFWFFDRGHFGWWLLAAFPVLCVVALARKAIVRRDSRARSDSRD
jgi:hypothetical protein